MMKSLELVLIEKEQLLAALRKRRRELREVISLLSHEEGQFNQQLLDEIVELSVDDIPVQQWPPQLCSRFLHIIASLTSDALEGAQLAEFREASRLQVLQEIANLLCSVAAEASQHVDNQTK